MKMAAKPRECGSCQVCCYALGIRDDKAPSEAWQRCTFQCSKGCSIYADRPKPCAVYRCMWLLGWGTKRFRPDRLGLLVESPGNNCGIYVKEVKPNALRNKTAREAFDALKAQDHVFFSGFLAAEPTAFTGTKEDMMRIADNMLKLPGSLGDAAREQFKNTQPDGEKP